MAEKVDKTPMLFFVWFHLALGETQVDLQDILMGIWSITVKNPNEGSVLPERWRMEVVKAGRKDVLSIFMFSPGDQDPMKTYNATFSPPGKGKFVLTSDSGFHGDFDFSPVLPPHLSAQGKWGNDAYYSSVVITNKIAQLSLFFGAEMKDWHVYDLEKISDGELSFLEKYFKYIFMGVVFVLCTIVSRLVQRWQLNKRRVEAEEILRQQKKDE
jgi:hypothetical protein